MENISISHFENDAVQDKKLDSYDWGKDNFLAGQELTVTITLGEYRELVASKATADQTVQASREKVVKLEAELKEAKAEAERLKAENQMEWVGQMNNIRERVDEIVRTELIYL